MKCVHSENGQRCDKEIPEGRIYCPKHEPKEGGGGSSSSSSGGSRGGGDILFNITSPGGGSKTNF
jgi:hypothetical protein